MPDDHRIFVDTELLYTDEEKAIARRLYADGHPGGPVWEQADRAVRGPYLELGGREWLAEFARAGTKEGKEGANGGYRQHWGDWANGVAYRRLAGWDTPLDVATIPLPPQRTAVDEATRICRHCNRPIARRRLLWRDGYGDRTCAYRWIGLGLHRPGGRWARHGAPIPDLTR